MKDISASCVIKIHTAFNPNNWYKLFSSYTALCSSQWSCRFVLSFARRRRRKHRNAKTLGSRPGITVNFHDVRNSIPFHILDTLLIGGSIGWYVYMYAITFTYHTITCFKIVYLFRAYLLWHVVILYDAVCQDTAKCRYKRSWYICRTLQ